MVSDRVSEGSDGIIQDQQVLVLVLAEGKHQGVQNEAQVGNQLCTGLLFQSRKCTDGRKNQRISSICDTSPETPETIYGGFSWL